MPRRLTSPEIWDALEKKGLASGVRPPDTSERKRRRQEESIMQRKVVRWFDMSARARWGLSPLVLFSVPNEGWRGPATAAIMKASGLRSGVPDIVVAVQRSNGAAVMKDVLASKDAGAVNSALAKRDSWAALFVEFKTPEGRVMPKQESYHKILREQGYRVEVVRSYDQAVEVISAYLDNR